MLTLTKTLCRQFSYNIRTPFDLKLFKQEDALAEVKRSLVARYRDDGLADNVARMLETYKKELYQFEQINKKVNAIQKEIKTMKKSSKGTSQEQTKKIAQMTDIKQKQKKMEGDIKELVKNIEDSIIRIGNLVDSGTPISKNQAQNTVLKTFQPAKGRAQHQISYSDICEKFGLTDLKRGQKVGGHRGYFLKNGAVKLALALAHYGLQFLQGKGYEIYQSPAIINESTLKGSCQLQSIEQDVYKLEGSDSYLIATSEQSLAGLYRDQVLARTKFPVRLAGYSTCFRKQAGAHGKDIHGLFRVHQFEKVEQFTIVEPQSSRQQMKRMMEISEQFYKSLNLPFRVVNIVSGELNDAASCKYDLEAWYPSQKRYRQLVSVSNCTQYQSRLLKVQYSDAKNEVKYPHMLNGTLVAIQRALTCIVENNYRDDHIQIPAVLKPYTGVDKITMPGKK